MTFNELKTKARQAGYNLDDRPFSSVDWPIIQGYLAYEFNIHTTYVDALRDVLSKANSAFSTSFDFPELPELSVDLGVWNTINTRVKAGLLVGSKETISVDSNVAVQVLIGNVWQEVKSFEFSFSQQETTLAWRYRPIAGKTNVINFSSQNINATYAIGIEKSGEPQPPVSAVCGVAVCGLTKVGM